MAQLPQRSSVSSSSRPPKSGPMESGESVRHESGERAIVSVEIPTPICPGPHSLTTVDQNHGMTTMVGSGTSFGNYRLERLIGRGGMASVYAAHRHDNGVRVAIKILQPDLLDDPTAMPRFMREGRMASTLKSPNSVRVLDVGVSNGLPFMVMELLEGEPLQNFLANAPKNRLSQNIALDLLAQTCSAVAEAHEAGIVHRDLTPGNLFLVKTDEKKLCVKVLDFGLAKPSYRPEADPTAISITQAGSCLGTPRYMAPEQILGARNIDPRTDVWALGVCLYTMLTGRHPFEGDDKNATSIPMRVLAANPTPPRTYRPDITPAVEAIVMRCLSAKPKARFANARELEDAIKGQLLRQPQRPEPLNKMEPRVPNLDKKSPSKTRLIASRPAPPPPPSSSSSSSSSGVVVDHAPPSLGSLINTTTGEPPVHPEDCFTDGTLVMPAALARVRPSRTSSSPPPPPPPAVGQSGPGPVPAVIVAPQRALLQVQTTPQPMRPVGHQQYNSVPPPPPPSAYPSVPPSAPIVNARQRSQPTVRVRRRSGNHLAMTIVLSLFLLFILCAAVAFVWARRDASTHQHASVTYAHALSES